MNQMNKPKICATITDNDINAVLEIEPLVDLLEVRIDLIGEGWQELTRKLGKPWIACNRLADEGGKWQGSEARRVEKLLEAIELGAAMIDIELNTNNLGNIVQIIKRRVKCIISYHDLKGTPSLNEMEKILRKQSKAGADVCKIVTTARNFEDNIAILNLVSEHPELRVIAFAMEPAGYLSRVISPLVGGDFTYASIGKGKESAPGQLTVQELAIIYGIIGK